MSWKGFVKSVNRLPARLTKMGDTTVDEDYNILEEQFKNLEIFAGKLAENTKTFKDSLSLMLAHQASLADKFCEVYNPITADGSTNLIEHTPTNEFANAMKNARDTLQTELGELERQVVLPTGEYISLIKHIKKLMEKRQRKLLDYDRHQDSLKKLREKQSRTVADEKKLSQLETAFDQASRDFNSINNQLKQDLAIFLSLRKDFIDPCLLIFYNYQIRVYQTLYTIFYQVGNAQFDLSTTPLSGYQDVADEVANMIGQLTITKAIARRDSTSLDIAPPPPYKDTPVIRASYDGPERTTTTTSVAPRLSLDAPRPELGIIAPKDYVIALYDFEAQAPGDLSFKKDDKIEVLDRKEDANDWWVGKINNRTGQFPGNYVADL
ncbi:hypothetical protein HDV06_004560 [Boothiomyces sp. JEL0866]|nr:hypothetical protein HDV06_004560 [Boothiomyces sp. JEL0866]